MGVQNFSLILIIALISCAENTGSTMGHWKSIQGVGLKRKDESFDKMLFVDTKTGFLFGSQDTEGLFKRNEFWNTKALLYRTIDGGITWQEYDFGVGKLKYACNTNDTIFVLKTTILREPSTLNIDSTYIYKSTDKGQTWSMIKSVNYACKALFCISSKKLLLISAPKLKNSYNLSILLSENSGDTWKEFDDTFRGSNLILDNTNNKLCYLTNQYDKSASVRFCSLDLKTKTNNIEDLPIGFNVETMVQGTDNKFWFGGNEGKNGVLYIRERENEFKKIEEFTGAEYSVNNMFVYDKTITVFLMEVKPSWTEVKVFRSENEGKDWEEEQLPINTPISNVASSGKDNIWIYSQAGRIQIRE